MASSGKKGKKNKGTVISLQSFLANGDAPAGTTQVAKKIRNVDGDDSDDGSNAISMVVQLPTAPRATRIFDDDSIPHKPPFIAYVTNLPFDADEDDIYAFFGSIPIVSLRLPREDGETGRVRGFGYVEFETRDDLIHVLSLPDPSIKGRRIRIELSNDQDQQNNRQRGNRRGYDGFGSSNENRDSTNWRRDTQQQESNGGSGFGNNYDRERERDRDRDRGFNRERKPQNEDSMSSWRTGSRPAAGSLSPRNDGRGMRTRHFEREDGDSAQERPKLQLKPRTLPLPEIVQLPVEEEPAGAGAKQEAEETSEAPKLAKPAGVPSEKVFGSAKPVDTAARELEIEQRLAEARRLEQEQRESLEEREVTEKVSEIQLEKSEKENANTAISWRRRTDAAADDRNESRKYSPDRRQDDRRRDNRERDYNRQNKTRDRNERSDIQKSRPQNSKDIKTRDDSKSKADVKAERPLPKLQPNQAGPVLQSSNKYSGLDDEASD